MTLTTTTAQTLTSPNRKRQLPKRPRLQKHRKLQSQLQRKQLQKRRRALGRKTTLQSQKSRKKQLQRRKRTLTAMTCREVILTSRTWSQQGTDQVG